MDDSSPTMMFGESRCMVPLNASRVSVREKRTPLKPSLFQIKDVIKTNSILIPNKSHESHQSA